MREKKGSESIKSPFVTHDNKKKSKPIAGITMAGIIVIAALLLSGLSLISSYQQPVIAQQQNMTGGGGGNATTSTQGGNATTTGGAAGGNQSEVRFHLEEARTALQNGDTQGAMMHLDLALNMLGSVGGTQGNATTATAIAGTDATNADRRETDSEEGEDSECGAVTVGGTSAADDYGCPPDPDY